jgi:Fe-Mn family superoxide dismutase
MAFQLPPLPYPENALEPHISARTMQFHHGKHHKKYVDTLNQLVAGTDLENKPLEDVIRAAAKDDSKKKIFNNAAQHWNHTFFWQCMAPSGTGGGAPDGEIKNRIERDLGGWDKFTKDFTAAAEGQFGSGWAWLVEDGGKLAIVTTHDADLPLAHGQKALLTCDVWEHAYYLDYQNNRGEFVKVFLAKLANWRFAQDQLNRQGGTMAADKDSNRQSGVEGEGSYGASRDYQKGVEKTVQSGQVEQKAREAAQALDSNEGAALREAEEMGRNAAGGIASGKIRDDKLKRAKAAPQGREAGYADKIDPSVGKQPGVEGEGSYTASRAYQKGVEKTVKSGQVEQKAREAKEALEGPEGDELRNAERRGQMAAKMEDPSLHTKGKGKQQS